MIAPPNIRAARAAVKAYDKAVRKSRVRVVPVNDGKQRNPRKHDKLYLGYVRQLPCWRGADGGRPDCSGRIDPSHLRMSVPGKMNAGMQAKPDDRPWTIPACRKHHDEQHACGDEKKYWSSHNIDPIALCQDLSAVYPDIEAGARVLVDHLRKIING